MIFFVWRKGTSILGVDVPIDFILNLPNCLEDKGKLLKEIASGIPMSYLRIKDSGKMVQ